MSLVRCNSQKEGQEMADALVAAGIKAIEITLTTPGALKIIKSLVKNKQLLVGAGTVRTVKDVKKVAEVGAKFIVSPDTNEDVIQATKKLKDQQHESSLPKYSGQPKNILQDVKTRWWSTYHMLKRLRFLREAISHYFADYPKEADAMTIIPQEWKICYQIEITLRTMGFWQRVLEGEKYVTGSLVTLAIYSIRQSFLQVIASQATEQAVKKLTRILLNDFDRRYHPTTNGH